MQKRDTTLAELSDKLGARVDIADIGRTRWLAETFDSHGISYPLTEKGAPSFTAGSTGWMHKHPHWLPQLIVKADKAHNAAVKFLEYLVSPPAQKYFAEGNSEFPVVAGVPLSPELASLGTYKEDQLNARVFAQNNAEALKIMDRAGWK